MNIVKIRKISLNISDNLKLVDTTNNNTVLKDINGIANFILVLGFYSCDNELNDDISRIKEKNLPFLLDFDNLQIFKLENNNNYSIVFNNSIIKAIPRSEVVNDFRFDILIFIPISTIIEGWD